MNGREFIDCGMLHTEDMQSGYTIERVTIRNPFAAAA